MANDVTLPATGTGTATPVVATDDVAGKHYQRIKLTDGAEDSATPIPGDANGLATQGSVAADAAVAGKPNLQGGRASDAVPTAVSADGDAVHAWFDRRGAQKFAMVDDAGDSVMDGVTNAVRVNVIAGSAAGTEYNEGETAVTIRGGAAMWEDTGDTLRPVSAAKPLPVNIITGSSSNTQYTEGDIDTTITGVVSMWEDTSDTMRSTSVAKPFPVQVVTSPGGSVLPDPVVNSSAVAVPIKFASVNATADGDNTVIALVASKKLRVLGYVVTCTGAGTIQFKTGGGGVLGRLIASANGAGGSYAGGVDAPAFETVSGEALLLNNPAGVDTVGHLSYIEV